MELIYIDVEKLRCPRCKGEVARSLAINGQATKSWFNCVNVKHCKTYIWVAVPLHHQAAIQRDASSRINVFGAYGSGKTTGVMHDDQKHVLITPLGETLIGADTLIQLDNTIRKDFERDFPINFLKNYNRQKNMMIFKNGHIVYWRPLLDVGDIRSYNLTRAHVVEASETKHEAYVELQARVRNEAAIQYKRDKNGSPIIKWDPEREQYVKEEAFNWLKLITESNPDSNWIKHELLLKSGTIVLHHETDDEYEVDPNEALPFMSTHVIPTKANYHLPKDFYKNMAADKPNWWVRRFLRGSFKYSEGLVYPRWQEQVIDDFEIPRSWPRIVGYDYGLSHNSHFVYGALDLEGQVKGHPAIFFYSELVVNQMNIKEIAAAYKQHNRHALPADMLWTTPRMDPTSYVAPDKAHTKKTTGTLLREAGAFFLPGERDLDFGILHMNTFIEERKVYFFKEGFKRTNKEAADYRFPPKRLDKRTENEDKPLDRRNHGVDATRFIMSVIPRTFDKKRNRPLSNTSQAVQYVPKRQWDPLEEHPMEVRESWEGVAELFHIK